MFVFFFFQAEDGIRDLVRSRGLGDVYKRQDVLDEVVSVAAARDVYCVALAADGRTIDRAATALSLIHI